MKKISIIGCGMAGALLSLYLARRGYEVDIFESRSDIRKFKQESGRSINLALSCRGITGLAAMNLMSEVSQIMVPMRARAIHNENGDVTYQAFGRHNQEYINAILRSKLNELLINKTDLESKIHVYFDMKLSGLDVKNKLMHFKYKDGTPHSIAYEHLIGADGASSKVRESLKKDGYLDYDRSFLAHGYKELSISRVHGMNMAREHLHLWPRESFLLLGNPNLDDSITGSLFLKKEGEESFASLDNEARVIQFFKKAFPDIVQAIPNLVEEFFSNPTGNLSTIKCKPWYYKDQCLLIGDAAHGIVPFFGQGMNKAFEDCRILDELLDEYHDNWEEVMPAFFENRKPNTDAIAIMAMDNYQEILQKITNPKFNLQKQLEHILMNRYPDRYISKHVLVMFTNIPYADAYAVGQFQSEFLDTICLGAESIADIDWQVVDQMMKAYGKKLAKHNLK